MNNIFHNVSNRLKAIYLLWATLNLIIFVTSGNFLSYSGKFLIFEYKFYPFSQYSELGDYDLSELIVYLIVPISIYLFIKLWKKRSINE